MRNACVFIFGLAITLNAFSPDTCASGRAWRTGGGPEARIVTFEARPEFHSTGRIRDSRVEYGKSVRHHD